MRGPAMQRRETAADRRVAGTREPTRPPFRQAAQITLERLGKQHLGEPRENDVAAGRRLLHALDGVLNRALQPLAGRIVAKVHANDARQPGDHRRISPASHAR